MLAFLEVATNQAQAMHTHPTDQARRERSKVPRDCSQIDDHSVHLDETFALVSREDGQ